MKLLSTLLGAVLVLGVGLAATNQDQAGAKAQPEAKAKAGDQAAIARQIPSYPLTNCPISGEPLAEQKAPVDLVYDGQLVRLCCKDCLKTFHKDPEAVIAKIDAAVIAAQKDAYPLKTCPVSGQELGKMGPPEDRVFGSRLVRFCCPKCPASFAKDPAKFMAKVDAAYIAAQLPSYPLTTCPISGEELSSVKEPINYLYGTRLVRFCCNKCVKPFEKDPSKVLAMLDAKGMKHAEKKMEGKEAKGSK